MFGGDSEEVTPVPIPNTAVKLFSADGSWGFPPVRVGPRQAIFECQPLCWPFFVYRKKGGMPSVAELEPFRNVNDRVLRV